MDDSILIIDANLATGVSEKKSLKVLHSHKHVQFNLTGSASGKVAYNTKTREGKSLATGILPLSEEGKKIFGMDIGEEQRGRDIIVEFSSGETVLGEYTLIVNPPQLNISSVKFNDEAYSGLNCAKVEAGGKVKVTVRFNREVKSGEDVRLQFKIYKKDPGGETYKECDNKHKAIAAGISSVEVELGAPENHSGTRIAASFFLRNAVLPKEGANQGTVRYYDIVCADGPMITDVYWSNVEYIQFEKSPSRSVRTEVSKNEEAFLHIRTRQMFGHEVTVVLYERDHTGWFSDKHLEIETRKVRILDNVLCVSFSMDDAVAAIRPKRKLEGGDFELFCTVASNAAGSGISKSSDVMDLNFNSTSKNPSKSTLNGTKKFVIATPAGSDKKQEKEEFSNEGLWPIEQIFNNAERLINSGMYRNSNGVFHGAIDIIHKTKNGAQLSGGNIVATHDGIVKVSKYSNTAGNYVEIVNGKYKTRYMHMINLSSVKVNQKVKMGDILGKVGNTGRSEANHLHYEIQIYNKDTEKWEKINPVIGDPEKIDQVYNEIHKNTCYQLKNIQKMIDQNIN